MGRKARYIPRQAGHNTTKSPVSPHAHLLTVFSLFLSLALPIYLQLMYNQTGCACILTESYFVYLKLLMKLCVCAHLYMSCVILFSLRVFRYHCRMRKLQLYRFIDLYYCVIIHTQRQTHTIVGNSLGASADKSMTVQFQLQTPTPTHICY